MKFKVGVQLEVQSADDIELWDYEFHTSFDDDVYMGSIEELVEEVNMGDLFPLDENGVIIEPVHGIHEMVLEFNTDDESVKVLEAEVAEEYRE